MYLPQAEGYTSKRWTKNCGNLLLEGNLESFSFDKCGFKIKPHNADEKDFKTKISKYNDHLRKIENVIPKPLIRYFGWDLFHDGHISQINLSNDLQKAIMTLTCPNIKFFIDNNNYEEITCTFTCTFRQVVHFNIISFKADEYNDSVFSDNADIVFMYSEINTLENIITKYNDLYKDEDIYFNSLIIDTMPSNRFIEIVFEGVDVEPVEELSFHQIMNDKRYFVPFYGNHENRI